MGDCTMLLRSRLYPAVPDLTCGEPAEYWLVSEYGDQPICAEHARSAEHLIATEGILRPDGEVYFQRGEVRLVAERTESPQSPYVADSEPLEGQSGVPVHSKAGEGE